MVRCSTLSAQHTAHGTAQLTACRALASWCCAIRCLKSPCLLSNVAPTQAWFLMQTASFQGLPAEQLAPQALAACCCSDTVSAIPDVAAPCAPTSMMEFSVAVFRGVSSDRPAQTASRLSATARAAASMSSRSAWLRGAGAAQVAWPQACLEFCCWRLLSGLWGRAGCAQLAQAPWACQFTLF